MTKINSIMGGNYQNSAQSKAKTENKTTNPPICKTVEIDFDMLVDKMFPKSDKELLICCDVFFETIYFVAVVLFLVVLQCLEIIPKIIPTVMLDSKCVKKSNIPILEFPNNKIPTVPIIKSGPELFVNASNLSASFFVQTLFS